MTPRAQKLVELTKELTDLIPAFPGTEQGRKFDLLNEQIQKLSASLTAAEQEEVNNVLGIFFEN